MTTIFLTNRILSSYNYCDLITRNLLLQQIVSSKSLLFRRFSSIMEFLSIIQGFFLVKSYQTYLIQKILNLAL